MSESIYAFDLDGTVTTHELLPVIASELDLVEDLQLLTKLTLNGTIDFTASFRLRFHILRSIPVEKVQSIVAKTPLDPRIQAFIAERPEQCVIVTGNLDCWIEPLVKRLGCKFYSSTSCYKDGQLTLNSILNKGAAIRELAKRKQRIIAIGESVNDIPMFEEADISIAYGGVHNPVPGLVQIADYITYDGGTLCQLLRTL